MTLARLTLTPRDARARVPFLGGADLALARVHEFCGPARRSLALMAAARVLAGQARPLVWISPSWGMDPLNPDGIREFLPPQHMLFLTARRPEDLLWSMEEALRAGVVPVVVADLPAPPAMTPVRRLHLAAETGSAEGTCAPLGLLLCPGEGGAPGVESRWHMAPCHGPGIRQWRLERRRARMAPPKGWDLRPTSQGLEATPTTPPPL
jgi:Uncharacterized conserved protein